MTTFTKLNVASKIKKGDNLVTIFKVKKEGTRRIFFSAEYNDKKITSTMFARLYDAENLAKAYLNHVTN
jgi:DNA-binding transcriptional regulator GbsR (MarR family)